METKKNITKEPMTQEDLMKIIEIQRCLLVDMFDYLDDNCDLYLRQDDIDNLNKLYVDSMDQLDAVYSAKEPGEGIKDSAFHNDMVVWHEYREGYDIEIEEEA